MGVKAQVIVGALQRRRRPEVHDEVPTRVHASQRTEGLLPLLGIVLLPLTTLIYVIVYVPGVELTDWVFFWVILALLLDLGHLSAGYTQRDQVPGVQSG